MVASLPGDSMLTGVALAFLTYGLFSCTDAIVKGLGPELPVAEIVFFATLFQLVVILFLRPPGERWRDMCMVVAGSPSTVLKELTRQAGATGLNYLIAYLYFGTMQHADALRSLQLFRSEVMPKLRVVRVVR